MRRLPITRYWLIRPKPGLARDIDEHPESLVVRLRHVMRTRVALITHSSESRPGMPAPPLNVCLRHRTAQQQARFTLTHQRFQWTAAQRQLNEAQTAPIRRPVQLFYDEIVSHESRSWLTAASAMSVICVSGQNQGRFEQIALLARPQKLHPHENLSQNQPESSKVL